MLLKTLPSACYPKPTSHCMYFAAVPSLLSSSYFHDIRKDVPYKRGLMMGYLMEELLCYDLEDKNKREERLPRLFALFEYDQNAQHEVRYRIITQH